MYRKNSYQKKDIDTYNILESSFNKLNFLKDRHGKYKFADPGRVLYNMAKKNPIDNPVIYKQFLQAYFIFPGNNDEFRASVPLMIGQKLQNIFELSAVLLESLKNIKKKLSEQYGAAISIAKDGASMPKQKIFIDPNSNNILKRYR